MRPTLRGWVLLAAVGLAIASAWAFGPRGLNAIAAPGIVGLLAAVWQLYRFDAPTVDRDLPARGEQGSTVRVRLRVATDTPRSARVVDAVDAGLSAIGADRTLSLGTTTLEYDLQLRERGERSVGPSRVVVRDVLGLLQRKYTYPAQDRILVHPRVHRLSGPRRAALSQLYGGEGDDRQAFESLRYYQRGDPLRDVHWRKSAALTDGDLVVRQFARAERDRVVEVGAEAAPGAADAMAEATASVAVALLEAGVAVGCSTPTGRVEPAAPGGRRAILDHLAVTREGSLDPARRESADVLVEAADGDVRVTIGGVDVSFTDLSGTRLAEPGAAAGEVAT